jgi:hypothetical protein
MAERRTVPRKKFNMYMRVLDDDTQQTIGHMVDISPDGLQLETSSALPIEKDYYLRVELTPDLADRPYMIFVGKSKWCKPGNIPFLFYTGFNIVEIMPDDKEIFLTLVKKFGA